MPAAICIALARTIRRRVGSIQQTCFNFHSEAEGLISAALSCVNRGIQVEACMAATPRYRNAARSAFALACYACSYPPAAEFMLLAK